MAGVALHDRPLHDRPPPDHKHKQPDKPPLPQGKGNAQRPLLGPRINLLVNAGGMPLDIYPTTLRPAPCPLLTLPYIPYPPPMYPIQYYPVETDPAMMGMMGGMGYVGYEESVYEGGMQPYYPHAPHYPPPHPHPHPHHIDHK
uniref:Uncharacterized protein n=1 Tax=Heliothis virescens TaxID=7102 RepID=A0A2A4JHY4_HELVI